MINSSILSDFANGNTQHNILVYCGKEKIQNRLFSNWVTINLGLTLSKMLYEIEKDKRSDMLIDYIHSIIQQVDAKELIIENIDILFSPEYNIDVLKLLIQLTKNKRVLVNWNGTYKDGILSYAEPRFKDYHTYEERNYDILCVAY